MTNTLEKSSLKVNVNQHYILLSFLNCLLSINVTTVNLYIKVYNGFTPEFR